MVLAKDGFKSSKFFDDIERGFAAMSNDEKSKMLKELKGVFQITLKNSKGKEATWTIEAKKAGEVYEGTGNTKADVMIAMADETFGSIAEKTLNPQKAFMSGKLKIKGNIMLATKLDKILDDARSKL